MDRQNIMWILREREKEDMRAKAICHSWFWSLLRSENESASYPMSFYLMSLFYLNSLEEVLFCMPNFVQKLRHKDNGEEKSVSFEP